MRNVWIITLVFFIAACGGTSGIADPSPVLENPSSVPTLVPASPVPEQQTPTQPEPTLIPTPTATNPEPTSTPTQPATPTLEAGSAPIPDASAYHWQLVAQGLIKPVGVTHAGDGSGRLFIIEQGGVVRVLEDGLVSSTPFLDIRDRVGSRGNEQGLLGLAFHPQYSQNGYFYVNYTDQQGDTMIARFQVTADDPDLADPGSEKRLLFVDQPFANHNGGVLAFGPDGYLYVGLGDGGSAGDPLGNGQSLTSLLGKILRLDVNFGDPYSWPPDNPFSLTGGGLPEIWAYGLRNPWRFSFDRLTGDLYIGDVGQNQWEEIDFLPAGSPGGANFGWSFLEGSRPYQGALPAGLSLVPPVAEYGHDLGCSVTGGVVYRGSRLPDWQGVYLYGDFCTGIVWGLKRDGQGNWQQARLFAQQGSISSFGEDEAGEVYLVDHNGSVYQLAVK
jgi:glucose/arabinose dehydrogenase